MVSVGKVVERYHRTIAPEGEDSLSKLAGWIGSGSDVLDVGAATGALGAFLSRSRRCRVDGVEIDIEAASVAAPAYRRMVVADLDEAYLSDLFPASSYDHLVFADILEHLRHPHRILAESRDLLREGGSVLISIPNFGYYPALAELVCGHFEYRPSGILDQSHTKFFTRSSLLELVRSAGLSVATFDRVTKLPHESEFDTRFIEALPPAVRAFLECREEARTYQFLLATVPSDQPGPAADRQPTVEGPEGAWPVPLHFVARLGWRFSGGDYRSSDYVATLGEIAGGEQVLSLRWPMLGDRPAGLRLEISDRPGLIHLLGISVRNREGRLLWQWDLGVLELKDAPREGLLISGRGEGEEGALLALSPHGSALELPLNEKVLDACAEGGQVELQILWPTSPEYMRVAERLERDFNELARDEQRVQDLIATRDRLLALLDQRLELLRQAESQVGALMQERERLGELLEERLRLLQETERQRDEALRERDKALQALRT